jgi:hypothetical protein
MKSMRNLLLALLSIGAAGLATPAFAWLNDSEQPGSVLVFPKFIRGTYIDAGFSGEALHAITEFEISVRCPDGAACDANQKVRLRGHWVCPECNEASFELTTTVNGSLYFNPEGVVSVLGVATANAYPSNATTTIPAPPCPRGYLIVWVIDNTTAGNPIKFDGLIGDAVIRENTDPRFVRSASRSYNAIPIQASENLPVGTAILPTLTDVNGDGALDFDGNEYRVMTGRIFGTVRYENATPPEGNVQTDLTLLTLDATLGRPNPRTSVGLNFYTTGEGIVDGQTSFFCWREQRLTDINQSFIKQAMGRKGLVESYFAEQVNSFGFTVPVTLLGLIETKDSFDIFPTFHRDYSYLLSHDGKPVVTKFVPGATPGF